MLDDVHYKSLVVKRGFQYKYYRGVLNGDKPVLLLLHGFPATSQDWEGLIAHFQPQGYGIIAPDMLGFGETAKPVETEAFLMNGMAQDIVDILDAEGVTKVVGVGHDWGSVVLSRLSMLHSDRFAGFVWLGLPFMQPSMSRLNFEAIMAALRQSPGAEGPSYWEFFLREDAPKVIEQNIDSFIQLCYPHDPELWKTYMVLPGRTAEWMDSNMQPGWPTWMSAEQIAVLRKSILDGGIRSGLNYYVAQVQNLDLDDNLKIPKEKWTIQHPSFYAVALNDRISTPQRGRAIMEQYGTDVTYADFATGHWPHLEATEAVNSEMDKWLEERFTSGQK